MIDICSIITAAVLKMCLIDKKCHDGNDEDDNDKDENDDDDRNVEKLRSDGQTAV